MFFSFLLPSIDLNCVAHGLKSVKRKTNRENDTEIVVFEFFSEQGKKVNECLVGKTKILEESKNSNICGQTQ